ncbi:MAG: hypothetical protein ACT4NV_14585 [Rhodoferax sp.]
MATGIWFGGVRVTMRNRLDIRGLNYAPPTREVTPIVWVALLLSLYLFWICSNMLLADFSEFQKAQTRYSAAEQSQTKQLADLRKKKAIQATPESRTKYQELQGVMEFSHLSWNGVLDALEVAAETVHGGVTLVALVPAAVSASSVKLNLTALAANTPLMLAYLEWLQKDPRVVTVELAMQQPEPQLNPSAVRFTVIVHLDPRVVVPYAAQVSLQESTPLPAPQCADGAIQSPFPVFSAN